MTPSDSNPYASRGGLKLEAALDAFSLDPAGLTCVDLGCSVGGFTDCLLQRGAARVFAVDTAYGQLAWKLRNDERVTVMERSNALYTAPAAACGLAVADLGWTRQERLVPVALDWLEPGGRIITLVKPHYEAGRHPLEDDEAERVAREVLSVMPTLGVEVHGCIRSPIRGGKGGNLEFLALLRPTPT